MITLNIQEAVPSRNQLDKMHWAKRYRIRGEWQWLVKAAVLEERVQVKCIPHAKVTIERFAPRKIDQDNFVGGCKYLIDSLKSEGFIVDDSPKHVTVEYIQSIGTPHTLVRIAA